MHSEVERFEGFDCQMFEKAGVEFKFEIYIYIYIIILFWSMRKILIHILTFVVFRFWVGSQASLWAMITPHIEVNSAAEAMKALGDIPVKGQWCLMHNFEGSFGWTSAIHGYPTPNMVTHHRFIIIVTMKKLMRDMVSSGGPKTPRLVHSIWPMMNRHEMVGISRRHPQVPMTTWGCIHFRKM